MTKTPCVCHVFASTPRERTGEFCWSSVLLLMASNAFGLGRRCWCSYCCYLYYLHTSEFLTFTPVNDFVPRRPLFWLFRGPVEQPLVVVFSAAATLFWNSLPEAVRSSTSLLMFRKSLKTELFARSYTD